MTKDELIKGMALAHEIEKLETKLEVLKNSGAPVEITIQGTEDYLRVRDASLAEEVKEIVKKHLEAELKEALRQFEAL